MNKDIEHIELIEKFLDNTLDMGEVRLFDELLETDEEFIRDLNDMEVLISGIRQTASKTTIEDKLERFNTSIKLMEDEEEDEKNNAKSFFFDFDHIKKYSWAIAASLTLLLVTSVALFNINQTPTNQKLYAEYYTPFENYGNKRSSEKSEMNYWNIALQYYDFGKYDSALANFEKIQINDFKGSINDPSFPLYKGNTLMKLGRYDDAIQIFLGMIDDNNGMVIQAKWYLSMCYLYENNTEKLVPLLKEIAEVKASRYAKDAQEILDQIN